MYAQSRLIVIVTHNSWSCNCNCSCCCCNCNCNVLYNNEDEVCCVWQTADKQKQKQPNSQRSKIKQTSTLHNHIFSTQKPSTYINFKRSRSHNATVTCYHCYILYTTYTIAMRPVQSLLYIYSTISPTNYKPTTLAKQK